MPVLFGRCTWWRIFNLRRFLSYLLFFMAFFSIAVRLHCKRKIRVTVPSAVRPVTPLLYLLQTILPMTRFFPSAFYAMNAFFEGRLAHFVRRSAPLSASELFALSFCKQGGQVLSRTVQIDTPVSQPFCLAGRAFGLSFAFALRPSQFRLISCPSQACKPGSYVTRSCLLFHI